MSSLRRRPRRSPSAASPLADDDLLAEILLRIPPQPSALPRASAVCQRWRLLVSDPRFLRRFRIHHRPKPPLLGFFMEYGGSNLDLPFEPTLDPPNLAPVRSFSSHPDDDGPLRLLNCRHGLLLILLPKPGQLLVWDPVIGNQHRIAVPPGFENTGAAPRNGAVLRVAGDVHHFQVILIGTYQEQQTRVVARVYSSEIGLWSNLVLTILPSDTVIDRAMCCVMVGKSLYWLLYEKSAEESAGILELDLDRQSLTVIHVPVDNHDFRFTVMRAEGGGLGFLCLSGFDAQLWNMKKDPDGVVSWVLGRTIELDKLLSLEPDRDEVPDLRILGFAEHNNVLFLETPIGVFMVQLEPMQFKKLSQTYMCMYHPFESVYIAETGIGGEHDGGGLLHNA